MMLLPKQKPWRSEKYLAFIRQQDCANCGIPAHIGGMDAHHVNGQGLGGGTATKISDCLVAPLCRKCHNEIHRNKHIIDQQRHALLMIERALQAGVLTVK
jgi:hypothetical protein